MEGDCLALPTHKKSNNDINDLTNVWRSRSCISILLLKRKLKDLKEDLVGHCVQWLTLPQEHTVKYLVKLFIDLGGKVFPDLCFFLWQQAF